MQHVAFGKYKLELVFLVQYHVPHKESDKGRLSLWYLCYLNLLQHLLLTQVEQRLPLVSFYHVPCETFCIELKKKHCSIMLCFASVIQNLILLERRIPLRCSLHYIFKIEMYFSSKSVAVRIKLKSRFLYLHSHGMCLHLLP